MAHTPTPWAYGHVGTDFWIGPSYRHTPIAHVIWDTDEARDNARDNAAFIVKCANAHHDMIDALEEALEYFEDRQDADHDQDGYIPNKEMQIASEIRRALDRAGVK